MLCLDFFVALWSEVDVDGCLWFLDLDPRNGVVICESPLAVLYGAL
jgi:hypothetical protein